MKNGIMPKNCHEITGLSRAQNTFMPPAIVVAAVLLIGLFCDSPASWASFHDYLEIKAENAKIEENYRDWLERSRKHQRIIDTSSHSKISRWRTHLQAVHFGDERQGLQRLNTMVNEDIVYRDDYSHFHVRDYWSEPDIVLEEGGDCEDIALLKAASLLRLNWPAERMQLLVGYLTERGRKESHAVLLVETTSGEQLIMRSIANSVIAPHEFSFLPIYAVNGKGVFIVKPTYR